MPERSAEGLPTSSVVAAEDVAAAASVTVVAVEDSVVVAEAVEASVTVAVVVDSVVDAEDVVDEEVAAASRRETASRTLKAQRSHLTKQELMDSCLRVILFLNLAAFNIGVS